MSVPKSLGEIVSGRNQSLLDDVQVVVHEGSDVVVSKVPLVVHQGPDDRLHVVPTQRSDVARVALCIMSFL